MMCGMREMEGGKRGKRTFQPFKGIRRAEIGNFDARSLLETKKFENPAISKCIFYGFNSAVGLLYACYTLISCLCSI